MAYKLTKEKCLEVIKNIRREIQDYFKKNNLKYAVFGKSMGLDSSVIAGLLSDIAGVQPIGVIMPIESDPEDERIAKIVLKHFDLPFLKIDLTNEYRLVADKFYQTGSLDEQLLKKLSQSDSLLRKRIEERKKYALGNIKVRLRMITLYHISQLTGGIVISTDNYSEYWMGFWTLHGDVGDFAPIQQIFKGIELYDIAKALGVPQESIEARPTDGLNVIPGGGDEDQLGLPYNKLDPVILELLKAKYHLHLTNERQKSALYKKIADKLKIPVLRIKHVAKQMETSYYKRRVPIEISREKIGLSSINK